MLCGHGLSIPVKTFKLISQSFNSQSIKFQLLFFTNPAFFGKPNTSQLAVE